VENVEDVKRRLEGYPVVMAERGMSYGMREIGVSEPNGHTVIFAATQPGPAGSFELRAHTPENQGYTGCHWKFTNVTSVYC
jgi:hypothetical protein